jgi:hypothetical protein
MITNFNLFESVDNINIGKLEINDYVRINELIFEDIDPDDPNINEYQKNYLEAINFTDTHIGRFHFFDKGATNQYIIKYKYVPDHLKGFFMNSCKQISRNEIKYWSKNKEDLSDENIKIYLRSKKYNII